MTQINIFVSDSDAPADLLVVLPTL
jgi:hypothetical protein